MPMAVKRNPSESIGSKPLANNWLGVLFYKK